MGVQLIEKPLFILYGGWSHQSSVNQSDSLRQEDETWTGRFNHQMSITNQAAGH